MFKWLFHILIFATGSGKYQNKEKSLKRQRKLGLLRPMQACTIEQSCNIIHYYNLFIHLSRMEFTTLINWTSLLPFQGLLDDFFFKPNFNRAFRKQIVETLVKRRVMRRLIFVCTIFICPTKRMLCLYWLTML